MTAQTLDPQTPQKVAAALLIIQVVIIISVFVGAVLSGYWSRSRPVIAAAYGRGILSPGVLDFALLLLWLLLTISPVLLTPYFKIGWDALGFDFSIVPVRNATAIAFIANIAFCSWFVFRSGGWQSSPFVSVVGALPAFAILIGEPFTRTSWYVAAIAVVMAFGMFLSTRFRDEFYYDTRGRARHGLATWVLAAAMLILTTALGYIRALPFA